jgi:hypothetical protein
MTLDVKVLSGIHEIVNKQNVQKGLDYGEIERLMINGAKDSTQTATSAFENELNALAAQLGLDIGTPKPEAVTMRQTPQHQQTPMRQPTPLRQQTPIRQPTPRQPTPLPQPVEQPRDLYADLGLPADVTQFAFDDAPQQPAVTNDFPNFDYSAVAPDTDYHTTRMSDDLRARTDEEVRHRQVVDVMSSFAAPDAKFVSLDEAKREEEKLIMLDEIDSLRSSLLEEDAAGLNSIPEVTSRDSYAAVENVLRRLRLKNDRTRYTSLADEFLLWGAYCLEQIFDGERKIFGKQPDLTGWSKEVQVKLRRMRHDTSTVVSDVMHGYHIGPMARIGLELIPNLFMFARRRKENHGKASLYADTDISKHMSNLQNIDA